MYYNIDKKELDRISKEFVILIDGREKEDTKEHKMIIKYLEKNKYKYKKHSLEHGDFSIMIPKGVIDGIDRDIYFDKDIVIERKKDIDELCNNLRDKATRLKSEFAHLNKNNTKYFIFVGDGLFFKHLEEENYRSKYNKLALKRRLKSICAEYRTQIVPITSEYMADEIYETLRAEVRNILKNKLGVIENE